MERGRRKEVLMECGRREARGERRQEGYIARQLEDRAGEESPEKQITWLC
jgi:hypothetical protein